MSSVTNYYNLAKEKYKEIGINTDEAMDKLKTIVFSLKCCDIVDVESRNDTSDYKSDQANSPKLRNSLEKAFSLIPGKHRVTLDAVHMDTDEFVELDEIEVYHYNKWISWARKHTCGMDFYTSMVRHEKSDSGFALSNRNKDIRYFWVEHCQRCRIVGQYIGRELGTACTTTINVNDFFESVPIDNLSTQGMLVDSLDKIYSEDINKNYNIDSVFTGLVDTKQDYLNVADQHFCHNYSLNKRLAVHVNAKKIKDEKHIYHSINSVVPFAKKVVIDISPEDNADNLIVLNDKLINIARYIINNDLSDKVSIQLDFKTELNDPERIKKWVIGARSVQKAFLYALLEPSEYLKKCDEAKDFISKAALLEEFKTYPFGIVWDYFCRGMNVPVGLGWLESGNRI